MRHARASTAGLLARAALLAVLGGCSAAPPLTEADVRRDAQVDLNQRASRAVARGELARAAALYREALRLARTLEDFQSIAVNALNLATVLQAMGDHLRAHQALEEILATPGRFEPRFVAQAAGRRAAVAVEERRLAYAAEWLDRAESACAVDCPIGLALLNLKAQVLVESGAAAQAEPLLARALAASRAAGDRDEEASALRLTGRVRAELGDPAAGGDYVARALAIDKDLGRPAKIAYDLLLLAEMALAEGRREAAHDFATRSLAVARAQRNARAESAALEMAERTR